MAKKTQEERIRDLEIVVGNGLTEAVVRIDKEVQRMDKRMWGILVLMLTGLVAGVGGLAALYLQGRISNAQIQRFLDGSRRLQYEQHNVPPAGPVHEPFRIDPALPDAQRAE